METVQLDKRLQSALQFVKNGARLMDVGTDHAHLPIFLVQSGRVSAVLASDVKKGPVKRAADNVERAGLSDKIEIRLTDGLDGASSFQPDHITVFGMGGEMIVQILDRAPWVKDRHVRLILQPMTHVWLVRQYLFANGFRIEGEVLSKEKKIYQTICAVYDGINREATEEDIWAGTDCLRDSPYYKEFLKEQLKQMERIISNIEKGGEKDSSFATLEELVRRRAAFEKRLQMLEGKKDDSQ